MFAPLLSSLLAARLAGVERIVHTEHSFEYLLPNRRYRVLLRAMSWFIDVFTVVGERMRPYYLNSIGVAPKKLKVVVNGVDVASPPRSADRVRTRSELRLPQDACIIGAVGRLAPEKNLEFLLRALARVLADAPEPPKIHLVVLGEGECRVALETLAEELGVVPSVSFLGWRTDVRRILDALDVFCMTSISEGLPLAMLEAMAAELAIVSTAVGDVPQLVSDGLSGYLVAQNDENALASRLYELSANPTLRRQLGRNARQVLVNSYERSRMVDSYIDSYTG
jgi:glycosyltransferase involved in cell wall biosynthesis